MTDHQTDPSSTDTKSRLVHNLVGTHTPDILDTLANLSNDEVFTPPDVANQMLDLLPADVWTNPDLRFLDPGVKTGVFLREAAKRLMVGLADAIPDEGERRDHIFRNMLYGLAITELTALMSRRTIYYTTHADDPDLSVSVMPTRDGNIHFARVEHEFEKGSCIYCGASQKAHDRGEGRESYAYAFIHPNALPAHWSDMRFDVIIGNPPYQIEDGGHEASASPLYHRFTQGAKALAPRYIAMIVPSRWFAGGKGLDDFRAEMLADRRIAELVDIPKLYECFPGAKIRGGVCYFLWDASHDGDCRISTVIDKKQHGQAMLRSLNEWDVLVRYNEAVSILRKIQYLGEPTLESLVSPRKPFGLPTNFRGTKTRPRKGRPVLLYQTGGTGWIPRDRVQRNDTWVDQWKVLVPRAGGGEGTIPDVGIAKPLVAGPGTAATETYLLVGPVDSEEEARHLDSYLRTKFVRFLISLRKNTPDLNRERAAFVPKPDLSHSWSDELLYEKYGLSEEERQAVEFFIRDWT